MITIDGHPTFFANRFDVNLVIGDSVNVNNEHNDIALHFNPRFHEHYVIRNSRQNGAWQMEEWAPKTLPFKQGKKFSIMILVEVTGFKVAVDNHHFIEFRHRLPYELACLLHIKGDVQIERITYHSASHGLAPPPHAPIMQVVTSGFSPYAGPPTPMPSGPVYSQSMGVPVLPPGPVFGTPNAPQVIHHPSMPFQHRIMGGIRPGHKIVIVGKPSIGFDSFGIELCKGMTNEVALQMNPRNRERAVVRNAKLAHGWGHEERDTPSFPFMFGNEFFLTIRVEHNRYVLMLNNTYFGDFHHRVQPLNMIDTLKVWGDVSVTSVTISND